MTIMIMNTENENTNNEYDVDDVDDATDEDKTMAMTIIIMEDGEQYS